MDHPATRGATSRPLESQNDRVGHPIAVIESTRINDWLLAILRFAVTLAQRDRAAVMALAAEMDRLGLGQSRSRFSYFSRTSLQFCDYIVGNVGSEKGAQLRLYIKGIKDDRLRRALRAAIFGKPLKSDRPRPMTRYCLGKGLATR